MSLTLTVPLACICKAASFDGTRSFFVARVVQAVDHIANAAATRIQACVARPV